MVLNKETVNRFNPTEQYKWIVIDSSSGFDLSSVEDAKVYKGPNEKLIQPFLFKKASASNAISIDFGISKADTRFICIMDPDFFVVYPNWINKVVGYMEETGVGILSAPYNPMWYDKAHRMTGHFMVIDTNRIPKVLIDFSPSMKEFYWGAPNFPKWLGQRKHIRQHYDCGSQIEEQFPDEIEYLLPLYDWRTNPMAGRISRFLDKIVPKKWRMTRIDYPVLNAQISGPLSATELYFWRGYPFAIHLRRYGQKVLKRDIKEVEMGMGDVLSKIYSGYRNILEEQ